MPDHSATTAEGRPAAVDAGLFSPVHAGTPVEREVTDEAWLRAMLDAEAALTRAQSRLGLVPPGHAETISRVARTAEFDVVDIARRSRETANPVVPLVQELTAAVAAVDGAAAEYVHRGSTSQDILDSGLMLMATRALRVILADVDRTAAALARLAEVHRDTPMPGRTLAQQAVPITFGLKAAGWLSGVLDARRSLRRLVEEGLPAQLGGAAGTLAGYLEYAALAGVSTSTYPAALFTAFAEELPLRAPVLPWHSIRTPLAELAGALAVLTGVLGKIALDVQVLSRTEIAELAEPGRPGRGVSSAMPHKRNPVLATLIRAAAAQVPLHATVVTQCLVAEDERAGGAWHAEWHPLRECLRLAGGAAGLAAELAAGLVVFPERMRANLDLIGDLLVSERVAVALAPILGKAAARELVNRASARAATEGLRLGALLEADPITSGKIPAEELRALLDPTRYTGAAGPLVDRALHRYHEER